MVSISFNTHFSHSKNLSGMNLLIYAYLFINYIYLNIVNLYIVSVKIAFSNKNRNVNISFSIFFLYSNISCCDALRYAHLT